MNCYRGNESGGCCGITAVLYIIAAAFALTVGIILGEMFANFFSGILAALSVLAIVLFLLMIILLIVRQCRGCRC